MKRIFGLLAAASDGTEANRSRQSEAIFIVITTSFLGWLLFRCWIETSIASASTRTLGNFCQNSPGGNVRKNGP
jgi:hypothetical protein